MTCIVGIAQDGDVWIGGDSAGTDAYLGQSIRADLKVWRDQRFVFGFTTSFRMGQLLRYKLNVPQRGESQTTEQFIYTSFIDAVRSCLSDGGWLRTTNGREEGGHFLVGYAGRLFCVESDFQVGETVDGFAAVGCGEDFALGALHATAGSPRKRIEAALRAAERFSAGVAGPFVIEHLRGKSK